MKNLYDFLRRSCVPAVLGCLLFFAHSAQADRLNLAFTSYFNGGPAHTGILYLTGTPDPNVPGAINVTSLSGTFDGHAVSLTPLPVSVTASSPYTTNTGFTVDNAFYLGGSPFDGDGLFFSDGTGNFNLFGDLGTPGVGTLYPEDLNRPTTYVVYSLISSVPEPGALSMCGTGLLAVAGFARRRKV